MKTANVVPESLSPLSRQRSGIRVGILAAAVVLVSSAAALPGAGASTSPDAVTRIMQRVDWFEGALEPIRERARVLERAGMAGELGHLIDALRRGSGLPRTTEQPPVDSAGRPDARLAALPGPIAELAAAVDIASHRVSTATRGQSMSTADLVQLAFGGMHRDLGRLGSITTADRATKARVVERIQDSQRRLRAAVPPEDLAAILDAGEDLGRAIDLFLAVHDPLRVPARPASSAAAVCDVGEVPGLVCVGGTGPNRYEHPEEYALIVDQGGDDEYIGSVASGGCGGCPPVSVVVDQGGADSYGGTFPQAELSVTAGVGVLGIGILVDLGPADDNYQADASTGTLLAQGVGIEGIGILLDANGNDSYLATGAQRTYAQAASGSGIGVLVDPAGHDHYLVEAEPDPNADPPCPAGLGADACVAYGQSVTNIGVALLVDGSSGAGAVEEEFSARVRGADRSPFPVSVTSAGGQALAGAGEAFLLKDGQRQGNGDTRYDIVTDVSGAPAVGNGSFFPAGQAFGYIGGVAYLEDDWGADRYRISVTSSSRVTSEPVACCEPATAENPSEVSGAAVRGQGTQLYGVVGALIDTGTNRPDDVYSVEIAARHEAVAVNDLEQSGGATATSGGLPVHVEVQGMFEWGCCGVDFLTPFEYESIALLLDYHGNDTYDIHATTEAVASAEARDPSAPERAEAMAPFLLVRGQGSGPRAALIDKAGTDAFTVVSRSWATADPTAEGASDGQTWVNVQGGFLGGTFAALSFPTPPNGLDTHVIEPNVGAQVGRPGEADAVTGGRRLGYWKGIHSGVEEYLAGQNAAPLAGGIAVSEGAGTKQDASLSLLTDAATIGPHVLEVAARLTTSKGVSLEGRPIRYVLLRNTPSPNGVTPPAYREVLRTHAFSNEDGVAEAFMDGRVLESGDYILAALWPGDESHRFALATASGVV